MDAIEFIPQILWGALGGLAYGLSTFVKYKETYKKVKFDAKKLLKTVGIGVAAGILAPFLGMQLDATFQLLFTAGTTAIVENLAKAVSRYYENKK